MKIAPGRLAEWTLFEGGPGVPPGISDGRDRVIDVERLGRGEPIVVLPGLAGGRDLLGPLARRLARRNQVIMPGFRGDRGVLGTNPVHDLADLADDVADLIDRLRLERPIVMGVSFGAAVALEYAVSYPEHLGGLVLWGGDARFRPNLGTTIVRRSLERFPLPADSRFLNQFFNVLHGRRPEPGPMVDFIVDRCWRTDGLVVAHRLGLLESFDVTDRLWRIDSPTLVMGGSRDVVVPAARQKALAGGIAGAGFVEVEGAGHVGFLTHRDEVSAHLATFARKVRRSYC